MRCIAIALILAIPATATADTPLEIRLGVARHIQAYTHPFAYPVDTTFRSEATEATLSFCDDSWCLEGTGSPAAHDPIWHVRLQAVSMGKTVRFGIISEGRDAQSTSLAFTDDRFTLRTSHHTQMALLGASVGVGSYQDPVVRLAVFNGFASYRSRSDIQTPSFFGRESLANNSSWFTGTHLTVGADALSRRIRVEAVATGIQLHEDTLGYLPRREYSGTVRLRIRTWRFLWGEASYAWSNSTPAIITTPGIALGISWQIK